MVDTGPCAQQIDNPGLFLFLSQRWLIVIDIEVLQCAVWVDLPILDSNAMTLNFRVFSSECKTDISQVRSSTHAIAGHVSQQMLAHYSHVRIEAKRKALDALSVGANDVTLLEINGTDSPSLIHQGNSKELFGWLIGPRSDPDCRICTKVNDSAILRRNRDAFSCLGIEAASQSRKTFAPGRVKDRLRPAQLVGNTESSVKLYLKLGFGGAHTGSNQRRGGMDGRGRPSHTA